MRFEHNVIMPRMSSDSDTDVEDIQNILGFLILLVYGTVYRHFTE